jgi:hypothetical protein
MYSNGVVIVDGIRLATTTEVGVVHGEVITVSNLLVALQGQVTTNLTNQNNTNVIFRGMIETNATNIILEASRATNAEANIQSNLTLHVDDTNNPHLVTAEQAGATPTNTIVVGTVKYTFTNTPSGPAYSMRFDPTTSNAWFVDSELSFQEFRSVNPDAGGTCTITHAHGSLVRIDAVTNGTFTVTFDNTDFPSNGVNRVGVELWTPTNPVVFDPATITNMTALSISTQTWTSLFFRRVATNLWQGRQ